MGGLGLLLRRRAIQAHPTIGNENIKFEDAAVEALLISKGVSSDGVTITKGDAEKVTSIGTWFANKTGISLFREFKFFVNVKELQTDAFRGCTLTHIDCSNIISISSQAFYKCSKLSELDIRNAISIGSYAFQECTSLNKISLDSVESISSNAFFSAGEFEFFAPKLHTLNGTEQFRQSGIKTFAAPSLTYIVSKAFYKCSKLSELDIKNVTSIGSYAFQECTSLNKISLDSIESISSNAFLACSNLSAIIINKDIPAAIEASSFNNTPIAKGTGYIYVPDAAVDAYKGAVNWSSFAARIKPISEYQSVA